MIPIYVICALYIALPISLSYPKTTFNPNYINQSLSLSKAEANPEDVAFLAVDVV